jgi:hypothetical protein
MQLSDQIRAAILPVVVELFGDTGFNCSVTLRQIGNVAWDDETKKNITDITDTTLTAIRMKHTKRSVSKLVGPDKAATASIQVGDSLFLLLYSDVTGPISTRDFILFDDQKLKVKDSQPKFELVWVVTVEGT